MKKIVHLESVLFNIATWISWQKESFQSLNFLALGEVDVTSEKVDTMLEQPEKHLLHTEDQVAKIRTSNVDKEATLMRETREEDTISRRKHQYICDKIHYHIRIQYTYSVNPPPSVEDNSSVNTQPLQTVKGSKFWAVIIGIDAYKSSPLRGCVSDALLVEKYLKEELGVPQERIQLLLGSQHTSSEDPYFPSRTNIVNTLLSLVDNPQIQGGDNIIIYFAGHGAGYFPYDLGNDSIEAICPIDRDTIDNSGLRVPDISDREINSIFHQISRSKGHRITFLLDSCHTGAHVRCFPEPGTRTIPPLPHASPQDGCSNMAN
ncbi:caspase domain-containing protein [Armillaria mellea]|nr:caspase domain-containing protein [Armillaria mellea]